MAHLAGVQWDNLRWWISHYGMIILITIIMINSLQILYCVHVWDHTVKEFSPDLAVSDVLGARQPKAPDQRQIGTCSCEQQSAYVNCSKADPGARGQLASVFAGICWISSELISGERADSPLLSPLSSFAVALCSAYSLIRIHRHKCFQSSWPYATAQSCSVKTTTTVRLPTTWHKVA